MSKLKKSLKGEQHIEITAMIKVDDAKAFIAAVRLMFPDVNLGRGTYCQTLDAASELVVAAVEGLDCGAMVYATSSGFADSDNRLYFGRKKSMKGDV